MILSRMREQIASHNWFAVGVELLVVIVGILIALQVSDWATEREHRATERTYLQRLHDDLQRENEEMDARVVFANSRIEAARLLDRVAKDPALDAVEMKQLPWALRTVTWRSFPQIDGFVYRELQSSGNLALIRSDALRRHLAEHYTSLENYAQVGSDLEAQHLFERNTIGLLTIDEMVAVEQGSWREAIAPTPAERAHEIARGFRERKEAIGLLANVVQHHTFNIKVISAMQEQGTAIMKEIDGLR